MPLVDALKASRQRDHAPFYTPGHRRGQGVGAAWRMTIGQAALGLDLPELPELDNLFAPAGAIAEAQELAAAAFGADRTWFLVNGSTVGILAAMLAICAPGEKILLPRNVHQSAIAGLVLTGAVPIFLRPEYDPNHDLVHGITPERVAAALVQHPDLRAVLLVSPTYYGVCSDVWAIAQIVHQHGIPLLVDEAHGAHFRFHPAFPTTALAAGADVTVQSIHKTLTSLTQSAMVHGQGDRVDWDRLSRTLQWLQSSSPSYLLLASLDAARHQIVAQGQRLWDQVLEQVQRVTRAISTLPNLSLLTLPPSGLPGAVALDPTRLTLNLTDSGWTGFEADVQFHQQWGVTAELPSLHHLTFLVTPGNTPQDMQALIQACQNLSEGARHPRAKRPATSWTLAIPDLAEVEMIPREAAWAKPETVPWQAAIGEISAELVCPYPPGIPVLLPGERITAAAIALLHQVQGQGGQITGCADPTLETLRVVA